MTVHRDVWQPPPWLAVLGQQCRGAVRGGRTAHVRSATAIVVASILLLGASGAAVGANAVRQAGSGLTAAGGAPGPQPPAQGVPAPATATQRSGTPSRADPPGTSRPATPPAGATGPATPPSGVISALAANGIPVVALDAYRDAAARLARTDPGCGIPWWLLAGIGRVESDHGRFAGAVLHADGTSTPRIIGIALDGTRSALIRDTDRGRYDGDGVYDHAVGPMQFIPSTWAEYGADGNGDGIRDPFNIFDAALAAADYLCAAGGNLRTLAGQTAAVLAYNHSDSYVAEVLALAHAYATGVAAVVTPPPVATPPVPPVNPAPPPAVARPATHAPKRPATTTHPAKHPRSSATNTTRAPTPTKKPTKHASTHPPTTPPSSSPTPPSSSPTPPSSSPTPPSTTPAPPTTPSIKHSSQAPIVLAHDGTIFVAEDGTLRTLGQDGKLQSSPSYPLPTPMPTSDGPGAIWTDGEQLIMSGDSTITGYELSSGTATPGWSIHTTEPNPRFVVYDGKLAYLDGSTLNLIDTRSGDRVPKPIPGGPHSLIGIAGDLVILDPLTAYSLNTNTFPPLPDPCASSGTEPLVDAAGGVVYCQDSHQVWTAVTLSSGDIHHLPELSGPVAAISQGEALTESGPLNNPSYTVMNAATGKTAWHVDQSQLVAVPGTYATWAATGLLVGLDPATHRILALRASSSSR